MKQEFLDFLNALIEAAPDVADKLMTDNVKSYISILNDIDNTKLIFFHHLFKYLKIRVG